MAFGKRSRISFLQLLRSGSAYDLWGRLGNGVNQARASAEASAGDLANATLSARRELATDYLALRGMVLSEQSRRPVRGLVIW